MSIAFKDSRPVSCFSKIWNKFSPAEKIRYLLLVDDFNKTHNFPPAFEGKQFKEERLTVSHNLACLVIWGNL